MNKFKPIKNEKIVISVRIEESIIQTIDVLAKETDISRNEFIVQCIEYALKSISEKDGDD